MRGRWLSLSEAAKWTQDQFGRAGRTISRKTVSRWARDGKVRAEQREQRWYVEPDSLRAFVAEALSDAEDGHTPDVTPPQPSDSDRIQALRARVRAAHRAFLRDLENGID